MEDYTLEGRRRAAETTAAPTPGERRRIVYKKIQLKITEPGKYIQHPNFVLEKNIEAVLAITMTADDEEKVFKLEQRLEINGNEILPQDFEARVLYAYASVAVNDRYFDLNSEPAGNGSVKITCLDRSPTTGYVPYNVTYYLKCLQTR
jgi:hypothetical protein